MATPLTVRHHEISQVSPVSLKIVGNYLEMNWPERILFAINIEYLWRLTLLNQDTVLANHNKIMQDTLSSKQQEYDSDKRFYLDLIGKMKEDIAKLKSENERITKEYEGMQKI